jgi:two-component system sensor histidine kinase HydH
MRIVGTMKSPNRLLWPLGALLILVATIAVRNSVVWYGRPIPGLLVDVSGSISTVGLPTWEGAKLGLRFPQKVRPAGVELPDGSLERTRAWDRAVAKSPSGAILRAELEDGTGRRLISLRMRPLEPLAWWLYAGGPIIAGLLYGGAALIALWASPRGRLARTFGIFSLNFAFFMLGMFDVHTQRSLAHVFFWSFALMPWTFAMLVMRLPDDVPLLRRFPALELICYLGAACLAAVCSVTYEVGGNTQGFQTLFGAILMVTSFVFTSVFGVRYWRARAERRRALLPLLLSMVPPYTIAGVGMLFGSVGGSLKSLVDLLAWPAVTFAPLASAYAFVRHDLWGSRALLSRIGTHVALGALACVAAIAAGAALADGIGLGFRDALAGAAVSTLLGMTLLVAVRQLSDSTLFRSRAEYKPTIEQLSLELLMITSPEEVARAIERTVRKWLPCDRVELTLEGDGGSDIELPSLSGTDDPVGDMQLAVAFGGRALARLDVGPKRGGALFTSEDLDLLRTIANQGALAIAHARAYQELEERRRQQAQAWRGEREALVETVAAEIAHEIRYPINYFRSVFERGAKGEALDAEDVDIGREEVDRLERLVSGLRRMAAHRLERSAISIGDLCSRADALLRDGLANRELEFDADPTVVLRCDLDKVIQILVNLVSNALEAAGEDGRVGVTWSESESGGELVVWDNGPGFLGDPARLFAPWFTTKQRGTGLGLAIAHRLVRAHGWNITAQRREDRTAFVISVRREDIVQVADSVNSMRRGALAEAEVA